MNADQFVGLGVDVGGTFTDAVVLTSAGLTAAKRPTTPRDQSAGAIAAAAAALQAAGRTPGDVTRFVHGMTITTNALLENKVCRTALIATAGFEDLEELGRQNRPRLYDLDAHPPAPLTRPRDRIGAGERCGPDGIVKALDRPALADAIKRLSSDIQAVAVNLLFSFRYPEHEQIVAEIAASLRPGLHVSLSHECVGTFREYERCSTTVTDAAVTPLVGGYLRQLSNRAAKHGLPEPVIMLSNGGTAPLSLAAARGSLTVLSGPAGGAAGGAQAARAAGLRDALSFDMGGTSTDVSLVQNGDVAVTASRGVGGRPLALPAVDIVTVGAGGGSIGWRDDGGALAIGPHSAGADPGPAAYQRGGSEPTVTDANLVLGYLEDQQQLGGEITLDAAAARQAVERLAQQLGIGLEETAVGIVRLANAEMAGALRQVSVARGVDPRQLALISFGGAGGLHCARLADELEMSSVLCPPASGTLSALGMLQAPSRADAAQSVVRDLGELSAGQIAGLCDSVAERSRSLLGLDGANVTHEYELRYAGQSHELKVESEAADPAELKRLFEQVHTERYGYADPERPVELVTIRAAAKVESPIPATVHAVEGEASAGRTVQMWFEHRGWVDAVRVTMVGEQLAGPAAIDLPDTTLLVPPGWSAAYSGAGISLERAE